jgi:hypothetical protein
MGCVKTDPRDSDGSQMDGIWVPDLVNIQKAIEHGLDCPSYKMVIFPSVFCMFLRSGTSSWWQISHEMGAASRWNSLIAASRSSKNMQKLYGYV